MVWLMTVPSPQIDDGLVIPPGVSIPLEVDLSLHAVPAIVLLIDLLLLSPPWSITTVQAFGLSGTLAVAYWFWVELCFQHNGWYV